MNPYSITLFFLIGLSTVLSEFDDLNSNFDDFSSEDKNHDESESWGIEPSDFIINDYAGLGEPFSNICDNTEWSSWTNCSCEVTNFKVRTRVLGTCRIEEQTEVCRCDTADTSGADTDLSDSDQRAASEVTDSFVSDSDRIKINYGKNNNDIEVNNLVHGNDININGFGVDDLDKSKQKEVSSSNDIGKMYNKPLILENAEDHVRHSIMTSESSNSEDRTIFITEVVETTSGPEFQVGENVRDDIKDQEQQYTAGTLVGQQDRSMPDTTEYITEFVESILTGGFEIGGRLQNDTTEHPSTLSDPTYFATSTDFPEDIETVEFLKPRQIDALGAQLHNYRIMRDLSDVQCKYYPAGNWTKCCTGVRHRFKEQKAKDEDICPDKLKRQKCVRFDADCETCQYTNWGEWSECSRECGGGYQFRTRKLVEGHINYCDNVIEQKACNTEECEEEKCELSEWSPPHYCESICSEDDQIPDNRPSVIVRKVLSKNANLCDGDLVHFQFDPNMRPLCPYVCQINPVHYIVSLWSEWSECSLDCLPAPDSAHQQHRQRSKIIISDGLSPETKETRPCDPVPPLCVDVCEVGQWSNWSSCDVSCGTGDQSRSRQIISLRGDDSKCPALNETRLCDTGKECLAPSVLDCKVSEWSEFGHCAVDCRSDDTPFHLLFEERHRTITRQVQEGGRPCPQLSDARPCNPFPPKCAEDGPTEKCEVSEWSEWKDKVVTEEKLLQLRNRRIVSNLAKQDCPVLVQVRDCFKVDCSVAGGGKSDNIDTKEQENGREKEWKWQTENGQDDKQEQDKEKQREKETEREKEEKDEVELEKEEEKELEKEKYREKQQEKEPQRETQTYDYEQQQHFRDQKNENDGQDLENNKKEEKQYEEDKKEDKYPDDLAVDCKVSGWGVWSRCSRSCKADRIAVPTRNRTRNIIIHPFNGGQICPNLKEIEDCNNLPLCMKKKTTEIEQNTKKSPCDIENNMVWSNFTNCSTTCGKGTKSRDRYYRKSDGRCAKQRDIKPCWVKRCGAEEACFVGLWSDWTGCTTSCGKSRWSYRTRTTMPKSDNVTCPQSRQRRKCKDVSCDKDRGNERDGDEEADEGIEADEGNESAEGNGPDDEADKKDNSVPDKQECQKTDWSDWTRCDKCDKISESERFVRKRGKCVRQMRKKGCKMSAVQELACAEEKLED